MQDHTQALREAQEDLDLARAKLQAIGIVLASVSFAIADTLTAQAKAAKGERKARKAP